MNFLLMGGGGGRVWISPGTQGCALRKITRIGNCCGKEGSQRPKIQGAQHKAYMKEIRLSGRPKAKVSRLRHPGTLRAIGISFRISLEPHICLSGEIKC